MNPLASSNRIIWFLVLGLYLLPNNALAQQLKPRLMVLADMGHDPDEQQQMVHLLMCSDKIELEGLIAVTGRFFRKNPPDTVKRLMPHLFHKLIDGYEEVYPNLRLHSQGYKSPGTLRSIVASGQQGNGMKDVGIGRTSPGAELIMAGITKNDPRPLYLVVNSGANTLAQALLDLRQKHTKEELTEYLEKLVVFDNGGQDEAGAWICHEFPDLFYIRSNVQTRAFGGPSNSNLGPHVWKPYEYSPKGQHDWVNDHIQTDHGVLGALYPNRYVGKFHYLEGGGTIPWVGLIHQGLSDLTKPSWGGWSGRYTKVKVQNVPSAYSIVQPDELKYQPYAAFTDIGIIEKWVDITSNKVYEDQYAAVWRWRMAMWNDLKARMDWCVKDYEHANHHPRAAVNGDREEKIHLSTVKAGTTFTVDATASNDPDGDPILYNAWYYPEAGSYSGQVNISQPSRGKFNIEIPKDAAGSEVHIILEIRDDNKIASLYDYRRMVVTVDD